MENWIFLFLGLILVYLLEFTRPWVRSYIDKRSLTWRERKLDMLVTHYKYIDAVRKSPAHLNFVVFRSLARALLYITLLISSIGIYLSASVSKPEISQSTSMFSFYLQTGIIFLVSSMIISLMNEIRRDIDNMLFFDKYKKKVMSDMQRLGGSAEDLEKEETKA